MPSTYYIGADGRVAEKLIGFQTLERMLESIGALLGESIAVEPGEAETQGFADRATEILESQQAITPSSRNCSAASRRSPT